MTAKYNEYTFRCTRYTVYGVVFALENVIVRKCLRAICLGEKKGNMNKWHFGEIPDGQPHL